MAEVNDRLVVELSANVDKLLAGLKKAGDATSVWGDQAGKTVESVSASFNGVSFEAAGGKMRQEVLRQIELQHQLDVARTAGDAKTVTALQRQIDLMQKIRQLRSAGLSTTDAPKAAEQQLAALTIAAETARRRKEQEERAKEQQERGEKLRGNPAAAVENVFSKSRLAVLEEGGAKVPIFGSALEELGAAGLVAAAGLAAAGEAAEQVRKAMEYASDLEKQSKALGLTTTALQQFDYANVATGVGVEKGREALTSFTEVFGKYSAGLANGRTAKFLDALGFTPESARQVGSINEALDKVLPKLAEIKNPTQRASLATQLGFQAFLPVLSEGEEGIKRFKEAVESAQDVGAVISPQQIEQAAELNEKFEALQYRVGQDLKRAFIDLAPTIEHVAEAIETIIAKLARFLAQVPDAIRGIGDLIKAANVKQGLEFNLPGLKEVNDFLSRKDVQHAIDADGHLEAGLVPGLARFHRQDALTRGAEDLALGRRKLTPEELAKAGHSIEPLEATPGADYTPPKKPKKEKAPPEDKTDEYDRAAKDALQQGLKSYLDAQAALTANIEDRAKLQTDAVQADLDKKLTDLTAKETEIKKAKVDRDAAAQIRDIEKAKVEEQNAAAAKKELIARNAAQALRDQQLQIENEMSGYDQRIRTAEAALANSGNARISAENVNYRETQLNQVKGETNRLDKLVADHSITPDQEDASLSKLDDTQRVERKAHRASTYRQNNPLYALANPDSSIGDDLNGLEAKGVESLGENLKDVALNTKTVKSAFHDMAQSIISDLAEIAIKRGIEAPLAAALFGVQNPSPTVIPGAVSTGSSLGILGGLLNGALHLAGGGPVTGPGGPREDRVPAMLSAGEYVMPAAATSRYRGLLDAIRNGALPHLADGGVIGSVMSMTTPRLAPAGGPMSLSVAVDASGAFSYEHVQAAVRRGVSEAVATSRRVVPMDLAARQRNTLPN